MSITVFGFDGSPTPTRPLAFIGFPLVAVDERADPKRGSVQQRRKVPLLHVQAAVELLVGLFSSHFLSHLSIVAVPTSPS